MGALGAGDAVRGRELVQVIDVEEGVAVGAGGHFPVGPLGLALGWPVMMGCVVLTANAWGAATGEWKGAGPAARRWMVAGTAALVAGVCLIGAALLPAAG